MQKKRRDQVREILLSKPFTSLEELQEKFPDVSSMTLRRDIEYFQEKGEVIKVRGGARAMHFITLTLEESYYQRSIENVEGKEKIAQAAIRYIETGRSMFFDSGSTVMQMLQYLPKEKLNISTADPNIALALVRNEKMTVNLTGGLLNKSNLSLSGKEALDFIHNTNIDVAFVSPSGFSVECGFTSGNYNEGLLKKAIVQKARLVVMLVQSRKLEKSMPHTFAELKNIDVLITDADPGKKVRKACAENEVRLIVTE